MERGLAGVDETFAIIYTTKVTRKHNGAFLSGMELVFAGSGKWVRSKMWKENTLLFDLRYSILYRTIIPGRYIYIKQFYRDDNLV